MIDELVLLTSYFNLVDGREQDAADTFRVDTDLPSGSSPDGSAALYIVTEASNTGHIGPRARRLAADTIAWEYSSRGDEPPSARLKGALRSAHEEVLREFDGHVAVGATVIAVERDSIYLAQVAPAQVYVLHEGKLHSVPASAEGTSPFARALGSRVAPRILVSRDQVGPGDVIVLCSTWFDRTADTDDIRECFGAGSAEEIAACLLELAKGHAVRDATAIVIEATLASELDSARGEDEPPGFMEQVDLAVQALAGVGRMLLSELRPQHVARDGQVGEESNGRRARDRSSVSALTAEVPLSGLDESTMPSAPAAEPTDEIEAPEDHAPTEVLPAPEPPRSAREQLTDEVPIVREPPPAPSQEIVTRPEPEPPMTAPPTAPIEEPAPSSLPEPEAARERTERPRRPLTWSPLRDRKRTRAPETASEPDPAAERRTGRTAAELDQVNSRLQSTPDMEDVIPPVQAFEEASTEPARIYATSKDIDAVNRRPRRFGGKELIGAVPVIRPGPGDIDLRKPVARSTPPAAVWATMALVLLAAAGALFLYVRHRQHATHTNPYPARVALDLQKAQAAKTPADQEYYLSRARHNITLARQNGSSPKKVAQLNTQYQTTSDSIHHITRVASPVLITDFARFPSAHTTQIAAGPGVVYVVDSNRKTVFSIAPKPGSNPTAIVQDGDTYNGFTVGVPQFVATDGNTALVVDTNDVLVRDSAGTKTATALTQQTPNSHIVAMAASDPDVYLLDTSNSQVWRYPYAVTSYNPNQAAYWDSNSPKLGNGMSIAFDKADLYILKSDGTMLKYDFQANPVKFTINLKTPIRHPTAFYTDAGQQWLWIADPANGRILQLDRNGGYDRTYRSATLDMTKVQSISASPDGKTIYVLAGSKLYDFPVTP